MADTVIQIRDQVDPKFVIGPGKLEDVVMRAIDLDAETLIFDCDLNPAQAHGIAGKTDLKVLDRSQLILDIFAQRAETRDGKLRAEGFSSLLASGDAAAPRYRRISGTGSVDEITARALAALG